MHITVPPILTVQSWTIALHPLFGMLIHGMIIVLPALVGMWIGLTIRPWLENWWFKVFYLPRLEGRADQEGAPGTSEVE